MEDDVEAGSDQSGPSIIETTVLSETSIALFFNENVEISSAENPTNYSINNGIVVESASRHQFQWSRVNLTTSFHSGGDYQVTVSNVMDELGNPNSGALGYYNILGLNENSNPHLNLYPNPSNGTLFIEGLKRDKTIEVVDILGKTVYQKNISEEKLELNLKLNSGLYFVKYMGYKSPLIMK